jgi:apolipoprotein N-acyltransferase
MKTSAPYEHWAPNVFRAIENRRYVLRANNTGISGIIDPWGRVVKASGIFEPAIIYGSAIPRSDLTFYTRHGDLFAQLCAIFCIGIFGLVILRPK